MRRTHQKPALAPGDLDLSGAVLSVAHARGLFFRFVQTEKPEVLAALPPLGIDPRPMLLAAGLVDEWQADVAVRTQQMRAMYPGHFTNKWCIDWCEVWLDPLQDPKVAIPDNERNHPVTAIDVTQAEYLRVDAEIVGRGRGWGKAFFERQKKALRAVGYVPTPRRHQHHFDWLARFQVCGKSFSEIARDTDRDSDKLKSDQAPTGTVRDAVVGLAEFIGLTLRHATRGGNHIRRDNTRPSHNANWDK